MGEEILNSPPPSHMIAFVRHLHAKFGIVPLSVVDEDTITVMPSVNLMDFSLENCS